jgi:hypothetical protein
MNIPWLMTRRKNRPQCLTGYSFAHGSDIPWISQPAHDIP